MKLQQMTEGSYFLILPKQIIHAKGWKKGKEIKVEINSKGEIILKDG